MSVCFRLALCCLCDSELANWRHKAAEAWRLHRVLWIQFDPNVCPKAAFWQLFSSLFMKPFPHRLSTISLGSLVQFFLTFSIGNLFPLTKLILPRGTCSLLLLSTEDTLNRLTCSSTLGFCVLVISFQSLLS